MRFRERQTTALCLALLLLCLCGDGWSGEVVGGAGNSNGQKDTVVVFQNNQGSATPQFGNSGSAINLGLLKDAGDLVPGVGSLLDVLDGVLGLLDPLGLLGLGDVLDKPLGVISAGGGGGLGGGGGGGLLAGGGGYGGGAGGLLGGGGGGLDLNNSALAGGSGGLLVSGNKGGIGGGGSGLIASGGGNGNGDPGAGQAGGFGSAGDGGGQRLEVGAGTGGGGNGFGGGGGGNLDLSILGSPGGLVDTIIKNLGVTGQLLSPVTDVVSGLLDGLLGPLLGGVTSGLKLPIAGGGGGGVTQGGQGTGLLNGSGAGGSLNITDTQLGINTGEAGRTQRYAYDAGKSYRVEDGGSLVIFGGSGGGGGIGLLDISLGTGPGGRDGYGVGNVAITQNGGVVNLLGGVGGGGGLVAGAKGGDGYASTADGVIINGGTFNVFGGAGGGANVTLVNLLGITATEGGAGHGAELTNSTLNDGEINIYAGADGGDITSEGVLAGLGGVLGGLTNLASDAKGGAGTGGRVVNLTMNDGTLNIWAGANRDDRLDASTPGGGATAETVANKGGTVNLAGGTLTGTYKQSGANSVLNLAGGLYSVNGGGNNTGNKGLFSGGAINALNGSRTLDHAQFNGTVRTNVAGDGSSLLIDHADIIAGGDLTLGANVTLNNAGIGDATSAVRVGTGGRLGGTYTQTDGSLYLSGGDTVDATTVQIQGGRIFSTVNGSELAGDTVGISGTVVTNTTGLNSTLRISGATVSGVNSDLTLGTNVTLHNGTLGDATAKIRLGTNSHLSGTFTQTNGTLYLSGGDTADAATVTIQGGNIVSTVNGSALAGDTVSISGTVVTDATGAAGSYSTLRIADVDITAAAADLTVGTNVTLHNGTLDNASAVIRLGAAGHLGGTYIQNDGTLSLAGASTAGATAVQIKGGEIYSTAGGSELTGTSVSITGIVDTDATGAGNSLRISGAAVSGAGTALTVGTNVTLNNTKMSGGQIMLDASGALSGTYEQNSGMLVLNGGAAAGADVMLTGGEVRSAVATGRLSGASIGGAVTAGATTGNALTLDTVTFNSAANLTLGAGAVLEDGTLNTGAITLDGGGFSVDYTQSGGTLHLNGDYDFGALTNTFSGGMINAALTSELTGADIAGGAVVTATAGAGATLTLSDVTIASGGNLHVGSAVTGKPTLGDKVILEMPAHGAGTITLNAKGSLGGTNYTLDGAGATLVLAGGSIDAAAAEFANGTIRSTVTGVRLEGDSFTGTVSTSATAANGLAIADAAFGADTKLTIGANVTLDGTVDAINLTEGRITLGTGGKLAGTYAQSADGTLVLAGGATTGADITLAGGTVMTGAAAGTLTGAKITGSVDLAAGAGALTLTESTVSGAGLALAVDNNVVLDNTAVTNAAAGTITVSGTGALSGTYTQNGAGMTLVLAGGSVGATDFTFNAGSIRSDTSTGTLAGADFLGAVTVTASTGNSLTLTGSTIGGSAVLDIGTNVTLAGNTNMADGRIILSAGGKISGSYTQTDDGELVLNGGATTGASVTLTGGSVGTLGGARTLDSATINGAVDFITTAGDLTLANATLAAGGALTLTENILLGANYTQTGGTLNLTGSRNLDTAGVTDSFQGGYISAAGTATLTGANIAGTVTAVADAGKTLTLDNVGLSSGNLNVSSNETGVGGGNVVLNMGTHTTGTVTLNTNGSLASGYTMNGGGLVLAGGSVNGAGSTFTRGTIESDMTDGRIDGAVFNGKVATSASADNMLTLENARLQSGAELDIGARVVLDGATSLTDGQLKLSTGGTLRGTYAQSGNGTLVLAGGGTSGADVTLSGGTVKTEASAGELAGATIDGDVTLTAGEGELTLSGATVDGAGVDLAVGNNVVLKNTANTRGTITLKDTDGLDGAYDQGADGTLVLTVNGTVAGGAEDVVTLSGGAVRSDTAAVELVVDTIDGDLALSTGGDADYLTITGSRIGNAADVTAGKNVILNNTVLGDGGITLGEGARITGSYAQESANSTLYLAGGTVDRTARVTISAGTVQSNVAGATMENVRLAAGAITLTTDGRETSTLTMLNANIAEGLDLTVVGVNVFIVGAVVDGGSFTVREGSSLSGSYAMHDGELILAGGDTGGMESAWLDGGTVFVEAADSLLKNAAISKEVEFDIDAGSDLTIDTALVDNGGVVSVVKDLTLKTTTLAEGGKLSLDGGALEGSYTQKGGDLTLNAGDTGGLGSITLSGGTVRATDNFDIGGADTRITGDVTFSGTTADSLDLSGAVIAGKDANARLEFGSVLNNGALSEGTITLAGGTLSGSYTQSDSGRLVLVSGSTSGVNGATFEGGGIESRMGATLTGVVIDGTVETIATGGGSLTLSGTDIRAGSALTIGDAVTLNGGTTNNGARITLSGTGEIDGLYTQGAGGELRLAGGTIDRGATFAGGLVNAAGVETALDGAIINGTVSAGATDGGALNITGSTILNPNANLILREGAVLSDSTLGGGRVTLEEGGALGGGFTQNGGTLALAGGGEDNANNAAGALFAGGTIASLAAGAELVGAKFTADMTFATESAGSTLTLSKADIDIADGATVMSIGDGVFLNESTLTRGTLSLDGTGALAGTYTQKDGTLILNGGATTGATTVFDGGAIEAKAAGSVLDDAAFNASVSIKADTADLQITRAHIGNGANLTLGDNVTLMNAELSAGAITLAAGSTLGGEYTQHDGGVLNLAGGTTGGAKSTFAGGEIHALIDNAILNDVHITGEVDIDADAGSLSITNAHITENGVLDLNDNVTLTGAELEQGEVILKTNSALGGFYKQSGGTLTMAGGDTNGVTGSEFSGGTIVAAVADSVIKLAAVVAGGTVHATVDDSADAAADLTLVATKINGGDLRLAAKTTLESGVVSGGRVTLETGSALAAGYAQSAGELRLSGGDASGAALTLSGGAVTAASSAALGDVEITAGAGVLFAGEAGATLTSDATTIIDGVLAVGKGGVLAGVTTVADGGLILDGGSIAGGAYEQSGGTLLLRSDSFAADTAAIRGGMIVAAAAGGATMRNTAFLGKDIGLAVEEGSTLTFADARIAGGTVDARESIVMDVTIEEGGLRNLGGAIVLNGIDAGGQYTQELGSLALADGVDTEGGAITLRSGTVIAAGGGEARLHGANVLAGDTVAAGESGGALHLASIRVDGGRLGAGAAVASLTDMSVTNSGLLSVGNGGTLAGATTLDTLGGIRFAEEAPGNSATVGELRGSGGVFHFTIDAGAGVTDHYVVEKSEGEHLLAVTVTGGGAAGGASGTFDLLTDASDGATYALAGNGLDDPGALLVRHELTSREEEPDGPRVWSLERAAAGLSSSAEGVGNAPAISLAQVTTGMDELGRHFRNLRGAERNLQSWKDAYENTDAEERACVELEPAPLFSVWASSYTHHMAVDAFSEVSMNMHGMDIGFERRFDAFVGGALYAGVVAGAQWLGNLNIEQRYSRDGAGGGTAYSAGVYGMWMNSNGWFAGAAARVYWTGMDLTSYGADNRAIKYAPGRRALAASLEFGRRISFGAQGAWHVEPSAALLGAWMEADAFMANGVRADYGVTTSLQGRAGVELGYTGERLSPYAELSFIHGMDGRTAVRMADERLTNDPSGTRVRAGIGATVKLTDSLSLSVDAAYERGASFRDVNGNVGINFSW